MRVECASSTQEACALAQLACVCPRCAGACATETAALHPLCPTAAWHFSYFKQPAEIVAKLASFAHPKTTAPYNDTKFHYAQAMRCSAPDHPDWRFEYLPRLVDVPSYVRLNRCRARSFYAYSQRRPASGS